jgi:hypothetical protein
MKLTTAKLRQIIKEELKDVLKEAYAVDPDQWMTQSPLDPGYQKLKTLAQSGDIENIRMAKELGYAPEIDPEADERVFSPQREIIDELIKAWIWSEEPDEFTKEEMWDRYSDPRDYWVKRGLTKEIFDAAYKEYLKQFHISGPDLSYRFRP